MVLSFYNLFHLIYTLLLALAWNYIIPIILLLLVICFIIVYFNNKTKKFISQKERLRQLLLDRETQVQTMFRSAPDAIIIADENGRILNWNSKAEKMFGWTKEEVLGRLLSETIVPERHREAHTMGMKRYKETGEGPVINRSIQIQAIRKNGEEFNVSLSISANKFGENIVYSGVIRDITEEKKAADNLRYNALLLDNVSDAVISTDKDLLIKTWNNAAEKMYGYTEEEVIGKNINFLGLNISGESIEGHNMSMKQQGFYRDEYLVRDKYGKELTILASFNEIESADEVTGYVAVHRDISIRKILEAQLRTFNKNLSRMVEERTAEMKLALDKVSQSEEKYRSLIAQAGDAIALFDNKMRILDVNDSATTLLGYPSDELKKLTLKDVLSAVELKTDPVNFNLLEKGESTIKPRKMIRKNGEIVETEVHAKKLPDGTFLALIRDLTERKKAEQELKQSYEAIRELVSHLQDIREEERLKMAQEIHDELGQQLTIMKMDVSWLDQKLGESNPQLKEKTTALKQTIDGTVKTVRRIASELRPSVLDDMGLAVAIEWHTREIEKRTGIKIDIEDLHDIPELNEQKNISLFRVVQESLTNVVRYAKASVVNISLQRKDNDVVLTVHDNGIGFEPELVAVKKTLGILGMRERIASLGGFFQIKSSPGNGTLVTVSVPI